MKTKNSGELFSYFLKEKKFKGSEVLHFGDNFHSDIKMSKKFKINSFWLPKTIDVFENKTDFIKNNYFKFINQNNLIEDKKSFFNFFVTRSFYSITINKIYDNPYLNHSDFLDSPKSFGYAAIGMFLFSIVFWLKKQIEINKIKNIVFNYRDGYLVEKAFRLLNENVFKLDVKISRSYFSRKSLLGFFFQNKYTIKSLPYFFTEKNVKWSFLKNILKNVISDKNLNILNQKYKNTVISGIDELKRFSNYCADNEIFLDEEKFSLKDFKNKYLDNIFCEKENFIFDIGYSGRISTVLKDFFNININELYIHINNNKIYERNVKIGQKINTFYHFTPNVTGQIREHIISLVGPEFIGFKKEFNKYVEILDFKNCDFFTNYITSIFQNESIHFIEDIIKVFGDEINYFLFNNYDLCQMLEYYINFSNEESRFFIKELNLENDFDWNTKNNDLWKQDWDKKFNENELINFFNGEKWRKTNSLYKFIFLWIYNKNHLASAISNKFKNNKFIYYLLKKVYNLKFVKNKK
ncbi:MAG: hypothetical protein HDR31_00060 [Mycoplasma sp.]|nr:hypothetical protein [Mycoplasma sp.]